MLYEFEPSEHQEQVRFLKEFKARWPKVRIIAIPNAGKRRGKTGARMVREGLESGVPDLFIPEWSTWIEMKVSSGGKLSKNQVDWIDHLQSIGHIVFVAKGCDDGIDKLLDLEYKRLNNNGFFQFECGDIVP